TTVNSDSSFLCAPNKKFRPQAAFYPNVNAANKEQKPFSRSAAKRESVMALGSIEHLQHYFTKTGLIAKKEYVRGFYLSTSDFRSNAQRKGLVPAIGSLSAHIKANPSLSDLPELDLPPSPALPAPSFPSFTPYVKTFEIGPENRWPGVTQALSVVEQAAPSSGFDTPRVLKVTTYATCSVRNYLLSLPDEHGHTQPRQVSARHRFPRANRRNAFSGTDRTDPLARIRRAALDVLTLLRELEKSARVPLSDDALYASFSVSVMQVGGQRESILVWTKQWDERFVRSSGWPYKQDFKIEDIEKQWGVVAQYLDIDEVLFRGSKNIRAGYTSKNMRRGRRNPSVSRGAKADARAPPPLNLDHVVSNTETAASGRSARRPGEPQTLVEEDGNENERDGDETSGVVEDHLPRWARWCTFPDNPLMRTLMLLVEFLPTSLLHQLPGSQDRAEFLTALSSGQSLCLACNTGVRRSGKPWGYQHGLDTTPQFLPPRQPLRSCLLAAAHAQPRASPAHTGGVRLSAPCTPTGLPARHLPRPFDFPPQRL
ncbi:hypothetical protein EDB83DRAFT_2622471, partial [Lactarius deliciosus]